MDAILTKTHDQIDGVLSANDDMAQAVIASLRRVGLAGKIPVTGVDATVAGVQSVIRGTQTMTVFRPYLDQARVAAITVADYLAHKPFPSSLYPEKVNNGTKTIPLYAAPQVVITKANVNMLITQGVYTKAQLCAGIPAGTGIC